MLPIQNRYVAYLAADKYLHTNEFDDLRTNLYVLYDQ